MKKLYTILFTLTFLLSFAQVTPINITSDLTADLMGYDGATEFPGQAEYFVFTSTDNIIDKPIFLIDGFDPGDTRNIDALYTSLDNDGNPNFTNLGDELRAEGFDVVVVNFPTYTNNGVEIDGGADFIERNALTLVKIIETINTEKLANASAEQNVIIGPSMGGLISRYALNYMENNTLNADTRLWISFDSPHLGANVPIGLQHQFNYLAFNNLNPVVEVQPIVTDVLNSPAARQLLIDHFLSHLDNSGDGVTFDPALTLPIPDAYRTQFETNINSLDGDVSTIDFPQNSRNIAVVNGSGIGASYNAIDGSPVTPGFVIVDTTLPVDLGFLSIDVDIDINMTPATGAAQQVSVFNTNVPFVGNINATALSGTTNFDGVDAAPGGLFDLTGLSGDLPMDGLAGNFLDALTIDKFSFIPTVSALALEITPETSGDDIDWYHDINLASSRATTDNTPFDNTFLPDDNEDHIAVTPANAAFMLEEIRGTTLSAESNDVNNSLRLVQNPILDKLILQSGTTQNASIQIVDFTGKLVLQTTVSLEQRTEIPVNLSSGFYILNVIGADDSKFTTKFIVNK